MNKGKLSVWRRIGLGLAGCLMFLLLVPLGHAETPAPRKIVVGYTDIAGFCEPDDTGYTGYLADYLAQLADYTGWTYEFKRGTWNDCLAWLEEGVIDLTAPAEYSEERGKKFLFSGESCVMDFVTLVTDVDNERLYYEDYASFDGITVGMIRDSYLNDAFASLAQDKGFSYTTVLFDTNAEMNDALKKGSVDAVVVGNLDVDTGKKMLVKFDIHPAYFITAKANTALMDELNEALYTLKLEDPEFSVRLLERYYNIGGSYGKQFTREEMEYVRSAEPLRVVCDSANYPYESYDEASGSYVGVYVDMMNLIAEKSGLTFDYIRTRDLKESWEYIRDGKADLISGVYANAALESSYRLRITDSFATESTCMLCKGSELPTENGAFSVAVTSSYVGLTAYVQQLYPEWQVRSYPNRNACLDAVERGEVNAALVTSLDVQTSAVLLEHPDLVNLMSQGIDLPVSVGVSQSSDPRLLSVLNKTLRMIPDDTITQIIVNHAQLNPESFSLRSFVIYQPRLFAGLLVLLVAVLVAVALALVLYRIRTKTRQARLMERKNIELERAYAAKSDFLSRMSHDMRTPLNAVLGFADLAADEGNDPRAVQEYIGKIRFSGEYLLGLINDVLDVSKIENGKVELHPETVDRTAFLQGVADEFAAQAAMKGITLKCDLTGATTRWVSMDKLRTRQIYANLLSNAIKFSQPGSIVEWTMIDLSRNAEHVTFMSTITDHGCGISKDFLQHLFEPFSQEFNRNRKEQTGTGLGLAIVKNLVGLMGGTIMVESELNKGTTFTIHMERKIVPEAKRALENMNNKERQVDMELLRGKRFLLCEDHPLNREIAVRMLNKVGALVDCAENGKIGVERFVSEREGHYAAILMDVRMPVMGGIEAVQAIRALECDYARHIPIIAMTANAFDEDRRETERAGMTGFVPKPTEPRRLYATLVDALTGMPEK